LEVLEAMTAPTVDGQPSLPKRRGPKGLLPSTWLERTLKVAYTDCYGSGQETSGTLLDFYPAGPILNVAGAKTMISWDRLVLCELVEDYIARTYGVEQSELISTLDTFATKKRKA
jgi:hypothetical protein